MTQLKRIHKLREASDNKYMILVFVFNESVAYFNGRDIR